MKAAMEKKLQLLIRHITTAAANASLYQLEHQQVLNLCHKALEQIKILHADNPLLELKIIDHRLICNNHPISTNLSVERLINSSTQQGISFIKMEVGIGIEELLTLTRILSKHQNADPIHKTEHISFGRIELTPISSTNKGEGETSDFLEVSGQQRDKFMDIYGDIAPGKAINARGMSEIVGSFINAFSNHSDILLAIAPLRSMDEYVYTHSTNICLLNLAQAKLLGIEGPLLNEVGIAAMLHDVGKMFIPSSVLNKEGKLNDEEWHLMQQHPRLGAEYLLNCPGIPRLAVVTAYEHHIGLDCQGYPHVPPDWQLNTCSHMTAISDVYDALRTRRPYKEPLSFSRISEIMLASAGKSLHPELTRSFLEALSQLEDADSQ